MKQIKSTFQFLRFLLSPLAFLYAFVTTFRNWRFDMIEKDQSGGSQTRPVYEAQRQSKIGKAPPDQADSLHSPFVISVGNLTVGGTGKTPFTEMLARELRAQKIMVSILTRGYGRSSRGQVLQVDSSATDAASKFGDEATLLAKLLKTHDVPVVVAADRSQGVRKIISIRDAQAATQGDELMQPGKFAQHVIIADDAHQHRQLRRNLNVLLIDATEPFWHYDILPMGRAREMPVQAFARADVLVVTRLDQISEDQKNKLNRFIDRHLPSEKKIPRLELVSQIIGWKKWSSLLLAEPTQSSTAQVSEDVLNVKRPLLVSAIARPKSFLDLTTRHFEQVQSSAEAQINLQELRFKDHHQFGQSDDFKILNRIQEFGCDAIFMTQKDAVKFTNERISAFRVPVFVSQLEVKLSTPQQKEELTREIFKRLL